AKAKEDVQALETALTLFYMDNSKYPTNEQGLSALVQQPTDPTIRNWKVGGYIERVSKDPWGNPYQYAFPGTHGKTYDLYSLGADGQPGGDGINADIGNWNLGN
ncbi:MAG: type II secretion system major pseudopilin GspG, partial [Steroidobacteraceae bacterium]